MGRTITERLTCDRCMNSYEFTRDAAAPTESWGAEVRPLGLCGCGCQPVLVLCVECTDRAVKPIE